MFGRASSRRLPSCMAITILALPGGTTPLPACLPLGIPTRIQQREFWAHKKNYIVNVKSYDLHVSSPSVIQAGGFFVVAPLPDPVKAMQDTQTAYWATNRLNYYVPVNQVTKKIIQRLEK